MIIMIVGVQVPLRVPFARIAQLVEHDLAKVGVAGSSPVSRSKKALHLFVRLFFMGNTEYFVYLLESEKDGVWYVGLSKDPTSRQREHNGGKSKFTKGHMPWKIIYEEKVGSLQDARKKEKYYKTSAGKRRLRKILEID
jgi:putative endonuclease